MADVTLSRKRSGTEELTEVVLISGTTVTGGTDTLTLTLADYGITNVLDIRTVVHTTDYSVIVEEAATSAVATGVLTVTTASGNDDKRRVCTVRGQ